ncbi:MAG: carboxypeptidase regulatory-like domain-containing protein [Gemmatimonadaceae bacterium]
MISCLRRFGFALCGLVTLVSSLDAQKGSARMFGTVVNRLTQGHVPDAVIVHADGRSVRSDSLGFYQFHDLAAGLVRFTVRATGFPLSTFTVALTNGERMERDIELDSAQGPMASRTQSLPEVAVEAPASLGRRYVDFERRKAYGRGQYVTRAQIEANGSNNLQDALRGLRGVIVECGGGSGCYVRMARAPMRCRPEYIVDERADNFFGPNVAVRDIEGIEVYSGPSDVPGEFAGSNAGCGVIVIWTRSGPPRRRG